MYQNIFFKRFSVFSVIFLSIIFTATKCYKDDHDIQIYTDEPLYFSFILNNNSDSAILIQGVYTTPERTKNGEIIYRYHFRDHDVALNDSVLFPGSIIPPQSSGIIKTYHYDKDKKERDRFLLICDPRLDKNEILESFESIEMNPYFLRFLDPFDSDVPTRKRGLIINYP